MRGKCNFAIPTNFDLHKSIISSIEVDGNKMADISFAPKREFPREFRALPACFNPSPAKTQPTQHKCGRAKRVPQKPDHTGLSPGELTKCPMRSLPEKFISQEIGHK